MLDINSLIAHAHRRIDQLQKQLIELQALEPVRVQAALDASRQEIEKLTLDEAAEEREKASFELESQLQSWVCLYIVKLNGFCRRVLLT